MRLAKKVNDALVAVVLAERRIDPYFRDRFDGLLQRPLVACVQHLINLRRQDERLGIAEERLLANEAEVTSGIIEQMSLFTRRTYPTGIAERAGNTKTYGIVRGEFTVLPDLPESLRCGVFREPGRTYPAWVRFAGPGPLTPPDIEDNGVLSIGIKLMGVEGEKLSDDEKMTQDFTGISAPTFTTPNIVENLKLQKRLVDGTPILYFLQPFDSHILDGLMQGLYARTHTNPLNVRYYSCVAYLFGPGRAIHYSVRPRTPEKTRMPRNPSANYLREAMVETLGRREVLFDFVIQFQTDPHRMPIENASVEWPERLSPFIPVATLRLPRQRFDSAAQLAFARNLSFNPWHCIADHRPLGNQNRARKTIYLELSKLRQSIGGEARIEPTGNETFDGGPV
ncbi:MAG TPA: catalase family protein [Thermomicrobiales bacterium]